MEVFLGIYEKYNFYNKCDFSLQFLFQNKLI